MTSRHSQDGAERPEAKRSLTSESVHSDSPLRGLPAPSYPPVANPPQISPMPSSSGSSRKSRHVHMQMPSTADSRSPPRYDGDHRAQSVPMPGEQRPTFHQSGSSWDLLAGIRKFEHSYEEFDSRNASEAHLAFAEGDMPTNGVSSVVHLSLDSVHA